MPITLESLRPYLGQETSFGQVGLEIGQMISRALQAKKARRSEEAQAAQRDAFLRDQLAAQSEQQRAVLGETTRSHQATEAQNAASLEADTRDKAATWLKSAREAIVASKGNPAVVDALKAEAAARKIRIEDITDPPEPTPVDVPPPIDLPEPPGTPTGTRVPVEPDRRFRLSMGDDPLAELNVSALSRAQNEANRKAVDPIAGLGIEGLTRGSYQRAADAAAAAAATPEDAAKLASQIAQGPARDATSMVNAARSAEGAAVRGGASQGRLELSTAGQQANKIIGEQMRTAEYTAIERRLKNSERTEELVKLAKGTSSISPGDEVAMAGRNALGENTRALYGAASSNMELQQSLRAGGLPAQMEDWMNFYFSGGEIAASRLEDLKKINAMSKVVTLNQRAALAEKTSNAVRNDTMIMSLTPELRDRFGRDAQRRIIGGGTPEDLPPEVGATAGGGASESRTRSRSGILAVGDTVDPNDL